MEYSTSLKIWFTDGGAIHHKVPSVEDDPIGAWKGFVDWFTQGTNGSEFFTISNRDGYDTFVRSSITRYAIFKEPMIG